MARGWINAHTHLYSALARFLPRPEPAPRNFLEILERVWWKLDRALDADTLRAGARLYAAEALAAGTSGLVDHHESPSFIAGSLDVLADTCQEVGLRAVLCYGVTERNEGRAEATRGLEECRRFAEANERPLVRAMVGVHASFTVSDETLREAGELAGELGCGVHLHVDEDACDSADARKRGYASAFDRLMQTRALPPGSILAHGVHMAEAEVEQCAELGLWLVQNPRSNRANGVGYAAALARSSRVALGTDGFPADMVEEAAVLRAEAGERGEDPEIASWRLEAGHALFDEVFGAEVDPGAASMPDLEELRSAAEEQAQRLGERLQA